MTDRERLIEAVARALVNADRTILGHHPAHIAAKVPAAIAALAAIEAAGFVVVPREPSEDMARAGEAAKCFWLGCEICHDAAECRSRHVGAPHTESDTSVFHVYRAMLAAAHEAGWVCVPQKPPCPMHDGAWLAKQIAGLIPRTEGFDREQVGINIAAALLLYDESAHGMRGDTHAAPQPSAQAAEPSPRHIEPPEALAALCAALLPAAPPEFAKFMEAREWGLAMAELAAAVEDEERRLARPDAAAEGRPPRRTPPACG